MEQHEILFLIISYFFGSIPFGFLIFFIFEKKDIRDEGSGNIGATNVFRSKGKIAGIVTLLLDILKGVLPIIYGLNHFNSPAMVMGGGAAVIIGHTFSIFLKFKSGKGVATFIGVMLAFHYPSIFVFVGVFLISVVLTKYVSAGSILGVISVFFFITFTHVVEVSIIVFLITALIISKHRSNIKRIFNGTENKFSLKKNG